MKKLFLVIVISTAYAVFLGLGFECLLNLLGTTVAVSLDGPPVTEQFPRFIPFCTIMGILALAALTAIFILNLKIADKYEFTKKNWIFQMIIAFSVSIPMIKLWEILFEFLQKSF